MSPQAEQQIEVGSYCQAWIDSLALLLSRIAAGEWRAESAAVPAGYLPAARVRITTQGAVAGRQWFSFAAADLEALLGIFLGEPVSLAGALDHMQREALEELVRQWAGLAASSLKPGFGEVTLQVTLETESTEAPGAPAAAEPGLGRLLRADDGTHTIAAAMDFDDALISALNQSLAESAATVQSQPGPPDAVAGPIASSVTSSVASSVVPSVVSAPQQPAQPSPQIEELLRQGNLELLMDVELAVMLRFGTRQAALREVLDLATGAVLELDREVQEPVDLVLNGKVIARGEVVVVDGNYGLRVMEVASPQQRVNSL